MTNSSPSPAEKWADLGDLSMRYLDWGGDGTPVLALHGLASCAHWYDLVAPELAKNHRVIAPDQRGHGQTTQAPTGYDWPTLAADVASLMSHLDIDKFSVLGHSWGGNVAINLAADYPNQVSSLVMIDGRFFGARLRSWRFDTYRTRQSEKAKPTLKTITIVASDADAAWERQAALADGVAFHRDPDAV